MKKALIASVVALFVTGCQTQTVATQPPVDAAMAIQAANMTIPVTRTYKETDSANLQLDLFLPDAKQQPAKLVVWVHGGAWMRGSKDETMQRNGNLVRSLLQKGYAVAAVDYRLSGQAKYPAAIEDVNDSINYLVANQQELNLQADQVIVMGGSAGGHLASVIATANNDKAPFFSSAPQYKIVGAVDFYGPVDLHELKGNSGDVDHDAPDAAEARFLGVSPRQNEALAKEASATTYVDAQTPPFMIFHGTDDGVVPDSQSTLMADTLKQAGVPYSVELVKGARHGDPVFDTDKYVNQVVQFTQQHLK
ncbi:alpha/beta hydrolase [Salinimonas lutimaris]|uniref:alpha/beta hydrolase n=1 Tax=Salinimonas lutimaris TaxID=914153 RepID=UPI0010BFFD01|nr:alpha/beta hydrolase [Salinimonas lutimaris]